MDTKDNLVFTNRSAVFNKDITTFAIDPLGRTAVLCGKRGLFLVRLDEKKLDISRTLRDPRNAGKDISGVRWSRNPNILASTCLQELTLWDLGSDKQSPILWKLPCHRRAISGFDWSNHQDNVLATASLDSESLIYLWDTRDSATTQPVKFHSFRSPFGGASSVKWSRREEYLLAASHGSQLLVWDIRKESSPAWVIPADLKTLVDFDWSYRDDLQILTCAQGSVKFWNLNNPKKALGTLTTPAIRARYNPFAKGCIILTGQVDHSWDLWNTSDPSSPILTKEYGIDDFPEAKSIAPLSKFNWRRVLVGSGMEHQLVTWSTKEQTLRLWRVGADELLASGAEPTRLNELESRKYNEYLETLRVGIEMDDEDSSSSVIHSNPASYSGLASNSQDYGNEEVGEDYEPVGGSSSASSSQYGSMDFSVLSSSPKSGADSPSSLANSFSSVSQSNNSTNSPVGSGTYVVHPTGANTFGIHSNPGSTKIYPLVRATSASSSGSDGGTTFSAATNNNNTSSNNNVSSNNNAATNNNNNNLSSTNSSASSSTNTHLRAKASSTTLSTTSGMSPGPSPPGSFKFASGSNNNNNPSPGSGPNSTRRVPTSSTRSGTLLRPVSFDVEIDALMKHPPLGLTLEKLDKPSRMVLFSLKRGKTHVEMKITFPTMYPHGAPPSFTVLTNTSPSSTVTTKEILVDTTQDYVSTNRNCLAPAFTQLIEFLAAIDSEVMGTQIEANLKEHEAALTSEQQRGRRLSQSASTGPIPALSLSGVTSGLTPLSTQLSSSSALVPGGNSAALNSMISPRNAGSHHHHAASLPPDCMEYVVKPTDSLPAIALFFNMSVGELRKLNKIQHSIQLLAGQMLIVKRPAPSIHSSPAPSIHSSPAHTTQNNASPGGLQGPHRLLHAHSAAVERSSGHESHNNTPHHTNLAASPPSMKFLPKQVPKSPSKLEQSGRSGSPKAHSRSVSGQNPAVAIPARRTIQAGDEYTGSSDSPASTSLSFVGSFVGSPGLKSGRSKLFESSHIGPVEISHYQMRCKFVDRTTSPPQLVPGQMTVTNTQFYFEPDLDCEAVQAAGTGRYTMYLELKKISAAEDIKSMNLSLAAEDEGAYLQILTREKQQVNYSKILLFLGQSMSQVTEISQTMSRWIASNTERNLVESLNLDINTMAIGSYSQHSGLDLATRMSSSTRHAAGDLIGRNSMRESSTNFRSASTELTSSSHRLSPSIPIAHSNSNNNTPFEKAGITSSSGSGAAAVSTSNGSDKPIAKFTAASPKLVASHLLGPIPTRPAPQMLVNPNYLNNLPNTPHGTAAGHKSSTTKQQQQNAEDPDDLPQLTGKPGLLTQDSVLGLRSHLPFRYRYHDWKLCFNTAVHGTSLITFFKNVEGMAPTVIVIKDTDGHVFGGYASEAWTPSKSFFGTGESFLFSIEPSLAVYTWTGADQYFLLARRDFLAMGGGGTSGRYGLWLDGELCAGTSEVCKTFLNRRLSLAEEFKCAVVEVYVLESK